MPGLSVFSCCVVLHQEWAWFHFSSARGSFVWHVSRLSPSALPLILVKTFARGRATDKQEGHTEDVESDFEEIHEQEKQVCVFFFFLLFVFFKYLQCSVGLFVFVKNYIVSL